MITFATLSIFALTVIFLMLSPGPNMAFVMSQGASHGTRGGIAAALGIGAADVILTILTATGITAVIAAWPPSFDLIRYAGIVYLVYLAFKALQKGTPLHNTLSAPINLSTVFIRALINSLLNPKALLFFIVFLPQFVDLTRGSATQQLLILGGVLTLISIVFHALLGSLGGAASRMMGRYPHARQFHPYALATVLLLLAARLVFLQRPA